MNTRTCRACGAPIYLMKDADGKLTPLDSKTMVYEIANDAFRVPFCEKVQVGFYAHHINLCSNPQKLLEWLAKESKK